MIFRRFAVLPRFFFSEAPQSIEGILAVIKDISHLLLLILHREDTLVHSSVLLLRTSVCRLWLVI